MHAYSKMNFLRNNEKMKYLKQILSLVIIIFICTSMISVKAYENTNNIRSSQDNADFLAESTFFDYYGKYQTSDTSDDRDNDHYSFEKFNSKISQYAKENKILYPLYFGDFNGAAGNSNHPEYHRDYGQPLYYNGKTNAYRFYWAINRANRNDNYSASIQGIVNDTLDEDGDILQKTDNGTVKMMYFNKDIIKDDVGNTVTDMQFPFKRRIKDGTNSMYYMFSSGKSGYKSNRNNITDIVRINKNTNHLDYWFDVNDNYSDTVRDMNGVNGWGTGRNEPGFFPFNTGADDSDVSKLHYGFGTKVEIPFLLNQDGMTTDVNGNKIPLQFNFKGDDDVWVFIDGKLVLDMGGDHSQTTGNINFKDKKATVDHAVKGSLKSDNLYQPTYTSVKNLSFSSDSFDNTGGYDENKPHMLTLFYMERGMIESNLYIDFNFQPMKNKLLLEKQVDSSGVNKFLQSKTDEIAKNIDFHFNVYKNSRQQSYLKYLLTANDVTKENIMDGSVVSLKDKYVAEFDEVFNKNDNVKIKEIEDKRFSTKWNVRNLTDNINLFSGNGVVTNQFTIKANATHYTSSVYYVKFINSIQKGNIRITKELSDKSVTDDVFRFRIDINSILGVDLDKQINYSGKYYVNGIEKNTSVYDGNHVIEIKVGETAEIRGIPLRSKFTITELDKDGYEVDNVNNNGTIEDGKSSITGFVENDESKIVYTNKVLKGRIEITKVDTDDTSKMLKGAEFKIEKINPDTKEKDDSFNVKNSVTEDDGKVVFDNLLYGYYRITEVKSPEGYNLLNNPIEVNLNKNNNGIVKITVQNSSKIQLPYTGAGGIKIFMLGSVIFIATAVSIYILWCKRKIKMRK